MQDSPFLLGHALGIRHCDCKSYIISSLQSFIILQLWLLFTFKTKDIPFWKAEISFLSSANGHSTASQYSAIRKHRALLTRTNQKFHHKVSVFECLKIAQNYTQVSLPSPHSI